MSFDVRFWDMDSPHVSSANGSKLEPRQFVHLKLTDDYSSSGNVGFMVGVGSGVISGSKK
jgi:hypothetical protein